MNEQTNADSVKELAKIREIMLAEFGPRSGQPHGFAVDDRLPTWEFVSCVVRGLNTPSFKRKATNAETLEAVATHLREWASVNVLGSETKAALEHYASRIVHELRNRSV